ncbi:MAG TPA: hypothetical protein VGR88_03900, partial [Ktedonobacterales bacterium]|nr:hypothetical protein [Ktedonobacterales bacterium]
DSAGVRSVPVAGVRSEDSAGVRFDAPELPIKANDHALDATRYALHTALRHDREARSWMRAWLPTERASDGA